VSAVSCLSNSRAEKNNPSSFSFQGNPKLFLQSRVGQLKKVAEISSRKEKGDGTIKFVYNRKGSQEQRREEAVEGQLDHRGNSVVMDGVEGTLSMSGELPLNFSLQEGGSAVGILDETMFNQLNAETDTKNSTAIETLASHLFSERKPIDPVMVSTSSRGVANHGVSNAGDKLRRSRYDTNSAGLSVHQSGRAATPGTRAVIPVPLTRCGTPHLNDGNPATPTTQLRKVAGGVVRQEIRFSGMTPSLAAVVTPTQASRHSQSLPTTYMAPRSQQATRDLHIVLATQEKNEKKYQEQRDAEAAQFKREMKAHDMSAEQEQERLAEIMKDPLKRSDFTLDLVRSGRIKRVPDRTLHPEHFKGTFLAEAAKETALQTRDIFRRLEASWAAARKRRKAKVRTGK
jgi:hypothetical protein